MRIHRLRNIDILYPFYSRLGELARIRDEDECDGKLAWGNEVCKYEGVFGWGSGRDEGEDGAVEV